MAECIRLAELGFGSVSPNPMVGCVIVRDGKIAGSGYHARFGGPHAEVAAIQSLSDPEHIKNSEVYVSLEPCAHFGKTPPCADMLAASGCKRVIIGSRDPNPLVSGKGIARLRDAGIEVTDGVLEKECRFLNRRFFTFYEKKRPYVILKWAESSDGFMGNETKIQISCQEAVQRLHKWRTEEDAFLVGTNTLLKDNPELSTRLYSGKNPVRVAVDFNLRSADLPLHFYSNLQTTLILNGKKEDQAENTEWIRIPDTSPASILNALYQKGLQSVVVEGGRALLDSFIKHELYDEIRVFKSEQLNMKAGLTAPVMPLRPDRTIRLKGDTLQICYK